MPESVLHSSMQLKPIRELLGGEAGIAFAVLIGSRANNTAGECSDWDIAIAWKSVVDPYQRLARQEVLRSRIARALSITDDKVDLVDLTSARLTMKAVVAEEGLLLCVADELAWMAFLRRTWRELEDYYWDRAHAA